MRGTVRSYPNTEVRREHHDKNGITRKRDLLIPSLATSAVMLLLLVAGPTSAETSDEQLVAMSQDQVAIESGEKLYRAVCAACHAKNLSGASGPSLKDGEWLHGSRPAEIMSSIESGFAEAGMAAFGGVYSEEQLSQLTAFVLSWREGFEGLTYKIFELENAEDVTIAGKTPARAGTFADNLIDFGLPKLDHYALQVEGDFYTRRDQSTKLFIDGMRPERFDIEIEGELQATPNSIWSPSWDLKPGKQHLRITMYSGSMPADRRRLNFMVVDEANTIRMFPVSVHAKQAMSLAKYEIKAERTPIVLRKRIYGLPTYSVAVGLPSKINYAFNTRSCALVGMWQGDLLDVGPNITGRGTTGSIPLGDEVFAHPQQLLPLSKSSCHFIKYNIEGDPTFQFRIDDRDLTVAVKEASAAGALFHYRVVGDATGKLIFDLPSGSAFTLSSSEGLLADGIFSVDVGKHPEFAIKLTIREDML